MVAARRKSRLWAALIFGSTLLLVACDAKTCDKKYLRNLRMEFCSSARGKRSLPADVLDPTHHLASTIKESHIRKRQVMSIREIMLSSRVPIYNIPYPPVPNFFIHPRAPIVPPTNSDVDQPSRRFQNLPQITGADLDLEEIVDLFNELYESTPRSSRMSRDAAEQDFKLFVHECCKGLTDKCFSKVPCPN